MMIISCESSNYIKRFYNFHQANWMSPAKPSVVGELGIEYSSAWIAMYSSITSGIP